MEKLLKKIYCMQKQAEQYSLQKLYEKCNKNLGLEKSCNDVTNTK